MKRGRNRKRNEEIAQTREHEKIFSCDCITILEILVVLDDMESHDKISSFFNAITSLLLSLEDLFLLFCIIILEIRYK
jgi:hypothetical protein